MSRISVDEYFMRMAVLVSMRGTCDRRRIGCVIVDSMNHVLATGYNGSLPGALHCDSAGHLLVNVDGQPRCVRTVHAEANAVAHAARTGVSVNGGTAYCTCRPCPTCTMLLVSAGVTKVVYLEPYHKREDELSSSSLGVMIPIEQYVGPEFR